MIDLDITSKFLEMRRSGVPLIAVRSPDPMQFAHGINSTSNKVAHEKGWKAERIDRLIGKAPTFIWDSIRGLTPINKAASEFLSGGTIDGDVVGTPDAAFGELQEMKSSAIIFAMMQREYLDEPHVRQAISNLRDKFKTDNRTLVLVSTEINLPPSISNDFLHLEEELPDREAIENVVEVLYSKAKIKKNADNVSRAVEAMVGLSRFQCEQLTAVNLSRSNGIDVDELWRCKSRMIEDTQGLNVMKQDETFDDLVGLDFIKDFLRKILDGRNPPNSIVFIDELEKSISKNQQKESNGVSQDQLGVLLKEMQDTNARGILFYGVPGVGKSALAKAAGNYGGIPSFALDLGASKGSLVAESETIIRGTMDRIRTMSSGRTLWIATVNDDSVLPSELKSRFSYGKYFFDFPKDGKAIWELYAQRFEIPLEIPANTDRWTGREIRAASQIAYDLDITTTEATRFLVPACVESKVELDDLRRKAKGRFLDADTGKTFA